MMDVPSTSYHPSEDVRARYSEAYVEYTARNNTKAEELLIPNADAGCTSSMVLLGLIYSSGTEEQKEKVIPLFRKASELGDLSGTRNLAYCYAVGICCEKDKEKGFRLYLEAAEKGHAKAACNAGVMLDYGNGTEQNFEEAFRWYTVSAEGGCTRGMTNLGEYYLWGKGTPVDVKKAEYWFLKSGSPRALYRLAEIYLDTDGYKDPDKGKEYLMKASDARYSKAMCRVARGLESEDMDKAVELYNEAARKSSRDAIARLQELGLPVPESSMSRRRKKKAE